MAEITVTFKEHGGYEAPWVVVRGDSVDEVSSIISEMRTPDAETGLTPFMGIKLIAQEWREGQPSPAATPDEALAAVAAALPGTTEFPASKGAPTTFPSATAALVPATGGNASAAVTAPPAQSTPPCETCGAPTRFKSGTSPKSGAYSGYMCSADRDHFKFL